MEPEKPRGGPERASLPSRSHLAERVMDSVADVAILTFGTDRTVTGWNKAAERIMGWTEAEMLGRDACLIVAPEDQASGAFRQEMATADRSGHVAIEGWHLRKDGARFWGTGSLTRLDDENTREVLGYARILRDGSRQRADREQLQGREARLRRSEARLRTALSISTVGVVFWDHEWRLKEVNDAFLHMTGFSRDEAIGKSWKELTPPEFHQASFDKVAQVAESGEGQPFEKQYFRKDGSRWWGLFAPRSLDEHETVEFVIDISARKAAEDAVRARQAELQLVADSLPALVSFIDRTLTYRFANEGYRGWFGCDPADLLGRKIAEAAPAGWLEHRLPHIQRALSGEEVRFESVWTRPDGARRIMDARYLPRRDRAGSVDGFYVLVIDVTDRHEAERLLRLTAEDLERQIAERTADRNRMWMLSSDIMLVAGFDGRIAAVNPAWTTLFGWEEHELLGRSFFELVHPDDVGATQAETGQLSVGTPTRRFENRCRRKDGTYVDLSWTGVPDAGYLHAVGRDVSLEKEQAEALRATEEALRQSQKMEAVGQLTGGLAHDFNNLLTGISGSLELMTSRIAQGRIAELERYVATAQAGAARAAALTHRLLAFSRRQTLDPKPTDANKLIAEMGDLLRRTVGPQNAVEVALAEDPWLTLCDPNQLENAILNLCINARDAMPDGGRLTIETSTVTLDRAAARMRDMEPGQYVVISVTDTGTGMTPEVAARAFDPFFTTKPTGQGTGLGLSMIYGFVRQSGGHVRIHSAVGAGTSMRIYLPRFHGEAMGHEAEPDRADAPRATEGETVLVVDDEVSIRMLTGEVLEELGYRVVEAGDAQSALQVLRSNQRIDLLLTDVGLPGGLNGRQLADAAREMRGDLKVLFITGYAENAVIGHGHLERGMHVLTKPFTMEALASRIRAMTDGRP